MSKTILAFALPLLLLPAITATAQTNYDVYIIAGQSNADGRGRATDLPTGSPLAGIQSNVSISYLNPSRNGDPTVSSNGFVPLEPGFSVGPGENRNAGVPSNIDFFGIELSFAASISQATGSSNPVAIIKVTRGGTSLQFDWRVGGDAEPGVDTGFLYTALLDHIGDSLDELTPAGSGNTANIRGFLWHQGESDQNSSQYPEQFTHLVEGVRAEFGDDIPFVLGELAQRDDPNINPEDLGSNDDFNDRIAGLVTDQPGGVPNLTVVSSEGLVAPDNTHFDANSLIIFGERYAAAIPSVPDVDSDCLLADVDMNGDVDFNDIPAFVTVLLGNIFQCEADCDEDGIVDFNDIPVFVSILLGN